jgi:hypothetical protein
VKCEITCGSRSEGGDNSRRETDGSEATTNHHHPHPFELNIRLIGCCLFRRSPLFILKYYESQ